MTYTANTPNLDTTLNMMANESIIGGHEDNKITKQNIQTNRSKVKRQRQDKINNINEQLKGISHGKCFKFIKTVFKVMDLLAKPLSLLTGNQLNLKLSRTLDILGEAKKQNRLVGLQIDYQKINQVIEGIKKVISNDLSAVERTQSNSAEQTKRILQILDEIDQTMKASQTA